MQFTCLLKWSLTHSFLFIDHAFPFWFSPFQEKTNKIGTWVFLNVLLFLLWWHVHFQCAPMQNSNWDLPEIGKISPRLARSHRYYRDLVMMFGAFANFGKCSKTLYILPRLVRSHWDCWDLTKIAAILSWPLWHDKIMARFSYISQILLKYTHFVCFVHKRMCVIWASTCVDQRCECICIFYQSFAISIFTTVIVDFTCSFVLLTLSCATG